MSLRWTNGAALAPIALSALAWSAGLAMAGDSKLPHISPAERVMGLFAEPVVRRLVVPGDNARFDVWLFSKQAFDKTSERLRQASEVSLELPEGHALTRATWIPGRSVWWVNLSRGEQHMRVRVEETVGGSLFVLKGAGDRRDAAPWSPRYRPLPLGLHHGSLCPR